MYLLASNRKQWFLTFQELPTELTHWEEWVVFPTSYLHTGTPILAAGSSGFWCLTAVQLCSNYHYSWHNVYFQLSLPLLLLVWNAVSIPPRPKRAHLPWLHRCLLLLQGGLLFLSVLRVCHQWVRGICGLPQGCYSLGYPTTLCTSLCPGRSRWSCHQRFAQNQHW